MTLPDIAPSFNMRFPVDLCRFGGIIPIRISIHSYPGYHKYPKESEDDTMKKIVALILVGIMLLGVACAPKKKDDKAAAPAGKDTKKTEQSQKDLLGE